MELEPILTALLFAILVESNTHPVVSLPDDAAGQFQPIIFQDQIKRFRKWKKAHQVGKLNRGTGSGKIAHGAWVIVAAVLSNG